MVALNIVQKFEPLSENSAPHLMSQADCGSDSKSENFQKCRVCLAYTLMFLANFLRKRVCIDSRNVNNKYYIVIAPVEQSLQSGD